jgi:diketogulonate reductase-like aldo/keto reductase
MTQHTDTKHAPLLKLNNGVQIPAIGLGVFQTTPEDTARAVEAALAVGYRHIDTAASYLNEREVGEGIRRSGVDRADVFIETKVWINDFGYDATMHAFDKSAAKLGVEQIDLLILHQSMPSAFDCGRVQGIGDAARRRQGARHRDQQLHAGVSGEVAGADRRRSRRQSDRAASVLHAAREP